MLWLTDYGAKCALDPTVLAPRNESRVVELFAFAVIVTGRIWLDELWQEIVLFRLLAVGWGFLVSVEVCPY